MTAEQTVPCLTTPRVFSYYMTLRNKADNKKAIDANKDKLHKLQKEAIGQQPWSEGLTRMPSLSAAAMATPRVFVP